MSEFSLNKEIINLCEYSKQNKETCDYCNSNSKFPQYHAQSMSWYRNKVGGDYFFCSLECRDKFKNEKICAHCHYMDDKLKKPKYGNFVLCTSHSYDTPCYDKFIIQDVCSFCLTHKSECEGEIIFWDTIEKTDYYCCERCLLVYKNIVLKLDSDDSDDSDLSGCAFCHGEKKYSINGYDICANCIEIYKIFVFGDNKLLRI